MTTVWITRTQPGAAQSADAWAKAGFKVIASPVLEISAPPRIPREPDENTLLVFTSANGVFAYQSYGFQTANSVVTVGPKTALAAKSAGFVDVTSAEGTSADVTDFILSNISRSKTILHCSGQHVRGSITEDLKAAGYRAQRDIYYRSLPVQTVPSFDFETIDIIALYSPIAARTVTKFDLGITGAKFVSISASTDAELGDIAATRLIAVKPSEAAMIDLLSRPKGR